MTATNRPPTRFALNAVVCKVKGTGNLVVGRQPFVSDIHLDELRNKHRLTQVFRREGDDTILAVPIDSTEIIGTQEDLALDTKPRVFATLLIESLLRHFSSLGRTIRSYKPIRLLSTTNDDLLLSRAARGTKLPTWIEQRALYVLDTRVVFATNNTASVILTCDVRTAMDLRVTIAELVTQGLDPTGRYVVEPVATEDPRVTKRMRYVGRIAAINDDVLSLEDCEPGREQVRTDQAYLEPRVEYFDWCLEQLLGKNAAAIQSRLDALRGDIASGPARLKRIRTLFDYLRRTPLTIAPGFSFELGAEVRNPGADSLKLPAEVIPKPILVFDPSGQRTDTWKERGIDAHGPYDQGYFTPKRPRIALICQGQYQGRAEQFVKQLIDGLPDVAVGRPPNSRKPYEKGFIRRYALELAEVAVFPTKGPSAAAYRDAARLALEEATSRGHEWDLALVQIEEPFHRLTGNGNPYLVMKSIFMKRDVPVQEVTIEKMAAPASSLVYILNNISIATYAKLGGTPWLLKANQAIAHELVIGLGSYHRQTSRVAERERIVGITTVFTGDGRYLLESRTTSAPYDGYEKALLESLQRAISTVRVEQNWKDTDGVRLIFHAFKPFKDIETSAIDALIKALGLKSVTFAYLHFAEENPFLLFDESNRGASAPGGGRKGEYAAERGTVVRLSRSEALMTFTGAQDLKQASDGLPRPVLLKLHRNSTFDDMTYLARQAFAFASDSWRSFSPARLPTTILYSELMARLLRGLEDVSDWDPEAMLGMIGTRRWFL